MILYGILSCSEPCRILAGHLQLILFAIVIDQVSDIMKTNLSLHTAFVASPFLNLPMQHLPSDVHHLLVTFAVCCFQATKVIEITNGPNL